MQDALKILSCFHLVYSRLFFILLIPTSFPPCDFWSALTVNSHHKRWRAPKCVASPKWMLQIKTAHSYFEHLEYSIRDFDNEYDNCNITSWSLNMIYRRLFSVWFSNLDSHVYPRSNNKVRIYPRQLYSQDFTALKVVSASAIRTKLLTVHKLWVQYFFAHRGHLFMILIRESCYGRQRISLKIVIHSRVRFIAAYASV